MNASSRACCEHYQSGGGEWIHYHSRHNFSFPASQLLSSCLSTCPPDYLPTYRAAFVQIKGARMGARWNIISFHRNSFWEGDVLSFFARCASQRVLPASPANCPASFDYSLSPAGCLLPPTCLLKYPGYFYESLQSSKQPNPRISASAGCLHHSVRNILWNKHTNSLMTLKRKCSYWML